MRRNKKTIDEENFFIYNPYQTTKQRYGIFPMTVWPINDSDPIQKHYKHLIGDDGSARTGSGAGQTFRGIGVSPRNRAAGAVPPPKESLFSPVVMSLILDLYIPPFLELQKIENAVQLKEWKEMRTIFDPFGGGVTRAIFSSWH